MLGQYKDHWMLLNIVKHYGTLGILQWILGELRATE